MCVATVHRWLVQASGAGHHVPSVFQPQVLAQKRDDTIPISTRIQLKIALIGEPNTVGIELGQDGAIATRDGHPPPLNIYILYTI